MQEPIDLAQKAAEKGNPWFGLGHTLVPKREVTEPGVLPLADIQVLQERMFNMTQGSSDYMILSPYQAANWERWERRVRHSIPRERSKRHRAERWQKIRRRQRRAAQRRHARGER
jgi:hypothetical protein